MLCVYPGKCAPLYHVTEVVNRYVDSLHVAYFPIEKLYVEKKIQS